MSSNHAGRAEMTNAEPVPSELNKTFIADVFKANMEMARHHETQRSTITTVSFAAAGALLAKIYDTNPNAKVPELGIMLLVLGMVAAAVIAKLNERSQYHFQIATECSKKLEPWIGTAIVAARKNQQSRHRFTFAWQLHTAWVLFFLVIACIGARSGWPLLVRLVHLP